MTNSALFLVVLVTAVFMVVAAMALAIWLSPKSYNALKGEPYECGIETRGPAWVQFRVGYYLIAILFLVFDVEAVLLFPWATIYSSIGIDGQRSRVRRDAPPPHAPIRSAPHVRQALQPYVGHSRSS